MSDDDTTELPLVDFDMLNSFLKTKDFSQLALHYLSNETAKSDNDQSPKRIKATKTYFNR